MKIRCLLILILNITLVHAQQIHLQGSIVDLNSNLPIAGATISIAYKHLFYPTDNKGKFDIENKAIMLADSLSFSCIGYQTQKVKAGDLQPNQVIKLSVSVNMLKEVKIGAPILIKTGSKEKGGSHVFVRGTGTDMAAFIDGSEKIKGTIQTVGFYLSNGGRTLEGGSLNGGDVTAPFRVRVFAVDPDGSPGKELTKDIIIVSAKKSNTWFDVDISQYQIQDPDSGFFVSFTLLTYEYYKLKKGAITTDASGQRWATIDTLGVHHVDAATNTADVITPRLGVQSDKQTRSYFTTTSLQNMSWHWQKEYDNRSYLIRASIAPE
jgi:hypothetical protein